MKSSHLRFGRRQFLGLSALGAASILGNRQLLARPAIEPEVEEGVAWYDVCDGGVEGKGWTDTTRYFDRLPGRAEGVVREPVWNLSRHSAGMSACFETDAEEIHVRYRLLSANLDMSHMPATGVSGLDLYACESEEDKTRQRTQANRLCSSSRT